MNWNHIVFEAYCLFKDNEIPHCCINKPGKIGINCLKFDEKKHEYCPYLAFGKARTTLLLTDRNGDVTANKVYYGDNNLLNQDAWLNAENQWIKKWKKTFEDEEEI